MAGATHPDIDYDKAMGGAMDAYYSLLETLPYLTGGATNEDMKKMERESAVADYHKNVAFDKRDNADTPLPVYDHKKVGD